MAGDYELRLTSKAGAKVSNRSHFGTISKFQMLHMLNLRAFNSQRGIEGRGKWIPGRRKFHPISRLGAMATEKTSELQGVNSIESQQTIQQAFQQSFYSSVGHPVVQAKLC